MIRLEDVTKCYQVGSIEFWALQGISLHVAEGEMITIMGPSGSGKSTLMNLIGALDVPTSGRYILDGVDVAELDDYELAEVRNRKIGFVFQSFNLIARTTALHNVEMPLIYAGVGRARHQRAMEALGLVGLEDWAGNQPTELSGGQQQRVAIARALVTQPAILLADEPTGNLDSAASLEIMRLLVDLNRQGRTVVLITHDPEVAAFAGRVVHIRDGLVERDETNHSPTLPAAAAIPTIPGPDTTPRVTQ
ncbi:MAG: ABC transporter ATP-binding protein [Candidatus Dormibacteraeota bacterium]|nr:ABC transporter ATP-binding protein [Candidatus Dormibacteraeota bacterium]